MTQRHKHADVIHAWAEGAEVEYRLDGSWTVTSYPHWLEDCEYRVKPSAKKYRVALFGDGTKVYTSTADNQESSNEYEGMHYFVRWLTDWVEYEE